jgi:DNA-directed RNA polymerase specialized sigma24 family protein
MSAYAIVLLAYALVAATWLRSQRLPQALGMRARVVMLSVEGYSLREIAERLGVTQRTVWLWRRR